MQKFGDDVDNRAMESKYSLGGRKETYIFQKLDGSDGPFRNGLNSGTGNRKPQLTGTSFNPPRSETS